jgi:hypothetical protein
MIKVTIELFPRGDQEKSRILGIMQIAQTEYDGTVASYKVVADENPNTLTLQPFSTTTGKVRNYNRMQSVYGLIAKAARVAAGNLNRKAERRRNVQETQTNIECKKYL